MTVVPWQHLDRALTPDGTTLSLRRRGDAFGIFADGRSLMLSDTHGSEDALAPLGCAGPIATGAVPIRVLIGGLGMGFTLRSALDLLPASAKVTVSELMPIVVEWNRGPLAHLAGHPLDDPRVTLVSGCVGRVMAERPQEFDAVLLDVDNGPAAFTTAGNARLYERAGLVDAHRALAPGGTLAVWSARDDATFVRRLKREAFAVTVHTVRGRRGGGERKVVFVAVKGPDATAASRAAPARRR
jgi:spermidine synthase